VARGPAPLIDDDLAYVTPWGADPTTITVPVLVIHGGQDRVIPQSHAEWLAGHCPSAELRLFPDDGHISTMTRTPAALEWLHGAVS
jgi:pimeloyl-ACP methyl ester carboxylesterase